MAQSNVLKRYLDAGMAFTAMTQAKAEALVKDLVTTGEVQAEQAQAAVTDLLERSRKNTEAFMDQVRREIADSAESLGLATIADLTRVERLIDSIRASTTDRAAAKTAATSSSPAPAKKAAAKKAPAKKAAAKKATAKKAAAKKAPAKKAAAKKATAKKATAKKASAKKATTATKKAAATKAPAATRTAPSSTTSGTAETTRS